MAQSPFGLQRVSLAGGISPGTVVKSGASGLLVWTQRYCQNRCIISNLDMDWQDGIAFSAIVHSFCPEKIPIDELKIETREERIETIERAFIVAEQELGVCKLLDGEDLVDYKPDKKSMMTYLSEMYKMLKRQNTKNNTNSIY